MGNGDQQQKAASKDPFAARRPAERRQALRLASDSKKILSRDRSAFLLQSSLHFSVLISPLKFCIALRETTVKIAIASDHAGFKYKELLRAYLAERGHEALDFGCHSTEVGRLPGLHRPAAAAVASGKCERGIVLGGSGNGEAIAANRSTACAAHSARSDETAQARPTAQQNANMIALGNGSSRAGSTVRDHPNPA